MDFGIGFGLMSILFPLVFLLVIGMIGFTFAKSIQQWNKNNHAPRLTVPVTVVAKRTNVSHHRHSNDIGTHHSTTYYATFQVESGDRMELRLAGHEYGLLVEGDRGNLTFQGTRFLSFQRT